MDIVNWVYLKKAELIKQNLSDPTDLILLGADVTFDKRGDKYLSYAMTTAAFADAIADIIGGNFGTVTSIDVNGGTGISVTPAGPITTSGTFTVTNTAPDQIVVLTEGIGIDITGTYPNFTISVNGSVFAPYTVNNGLTENPDNNFQLGGDLIKDTIVSGDGNQWRMTFDEMFRFTANANSRISLRVEELDPLSPNFGSFALYQATSQVVTISSYNNTTTTTHSLALEAGNVSGIQGPLTSFTVTDTELNVKTPNVTGATATVGQVLTLMDVVTGEVEFQDAGIGATYTADNGLTENPANNFQLGGDTYADSTFDNNRYIDAQSNALFIKGQINSTFAPGGDIITGVLNITNDLDPGTPVGLFVSVDGPNITNGVGIKVNTSDAVGIDVFSSDSRALNVSSSSSTDNAVVITSQSTPAVEIITQANGPLPAITAAKLGNDEDTVEPVLRLLKSSNTGLGQVGIGSAIRFSTATDSPGASDSIGEIAFVASDVTNNSSSGFFRLSAYESGTPVQVLLIDGNGIFTLVQGLGNYANDAAAAAAGIPLNGLYQTAGTVKIRIT